MAIFQDVTLQWGGVEYTVPANNVMRLIAKVESEISLQELTRDQGPPLSKLALGYQAALNHAGARVSSEAIYESMFDQEKSQGEIINSAVSGLLTIMLPPSTYQPKISKKKPKAKPQKRKVQSKTPSN